ncbi:efflux RND transporter periplasmic adaptor subunit [Hyphomicrobium sp. 2TAF46]|uniref:efflux RND transporter periplasmic adaptor subunit n=1 Tax=Hyphomicrobium sp. 2TAF46 TaxID=3233019 RepID=UPI003F92E961
MTHALQPSLPAFLLTMTRFVILPIALTLLPLTGCSESQDKPAPPPRPVLSTVVSAEPRSLLTLVGTIEPRYRTDLSFRVIGRVITRDVDVGDLVRKGQRVAALDPTALELAVRIQRAGLSNAQAQLTNASATEGRQQTLRDRAVSSPATFEAAEQTRIAAQAEVVRAQSSLTKAQEQLGYAQLESDFDGVVTAVSAEVGQVVSAGETVVTIAKPDVREAVVDIPESVNGAVKPGTEFDVALQLDERVRVTGIVREIAPEADSVTRSRRVRITLENAPDTFRLGTTVTTTIKGWAGSSSVVRLPLSALLERDGQSMVLVIDEATNSISERQVTIASRDEHSITVSAGLGPGTRVVTAGVNSLSPGQKVKFENGASGS